MKDEKILSPNLHGTRNVNFDFLKCICAFLVVCIHAVFPGQFGENISIFARIAVPIFFMITGFFYSFDEKRQKKQIKKIFLLLISANFFYFAFNTAITVLSSASVYEYFSQLFSFEKVIKLFCFNVSPFSGHLWYLNALLYVLLIASVLKKIGIYEKAFYFIPLLLIGDLLFGKYSLIFLNITVPVEYVRNFLFVGLPFFLLGSFIKKQENKIKDIFRNKNLVFIISIPFFAIFSLLEKYLLVKFNYDTQREHCFGTIILALAVFILCLVKDNYKTANLVARIGKEDSLMIYILHPAILSFLSVMSKFLPATFKNALDFLLPVIVFMLTLFVARLHNICVRKIKQSRLKKLNKVL